MRYGCYLYSAITGHVLAFRASDTLLSFEDFAAWLVRAAPREWHNVQLTKNTLAANRWTATLTFSDATNRLVAARVYYTTMDLERTSRSNIPASDMVIAENIMAAAEYVGGGDHTRALIEYLYDASHTTAYGELSAVLELLIGTVLEQGAMISALSERVTKLQGEVQANEYSRSLT